MKEEEKKFVFKVEIAIAHEGGHSMRLFHDLQDAREYARVLASEWWKPSIKVIDYTIGDTTPYGIYILKGKEYKKPIDFIFIEKEIIH